MAQKTKTTPPQDDNTVTFKRSYFYAVLTVLAFAAGLLVGYLAWGRSPASQPAAQIPAATQAATRFEVPSEGFPSIGPEESPITIIEFGDYECYYCQKWFAETYKPLMAAYPGKIRLVYRNFPLTSIHPNAFAAAEAALCAGDQGAYWPFHDKLFGGQYSLGEEAYRQYAADLGLDTTAFEDCLTSRKYADFVQDDIDFAISLGVVTGTPTFFVNGWAVRGAVPLAMFVQIVDEELSEE